MGWPRIGHTPPWDLKRLRNAGPLARPLFWALRLWEWAFYTGRVDVATIKTDRKAWAVVTGDVRYWHAIFAYVGPPGHILWNIRIPLSLVMLISVCMTVYEYLRTTCCSSLIDLDAGNMSYNAFRLTSFAMSLMLAFRLRVTYARWWQARCSFTGVGGASVSIVQQAATYVDDPALQFEFCRWCTLWQFTTYMFVESKKKLRPEASALLNEEELALVEKAKKPRQVVCLKIRSLMREADLPYAQAQAMEFNFNRGWESQSTCSRIRYQAMPQAVSLLCTGFVTIWLMLLPFGLWQGDADRGHWIGVPIMFFVAVLLLGVDAVTNQLENPWKLIPMEAYLNSTITDCRRNLDEAKALRELRQRQQAKDALDSGVEPGPKNSWVVEVGQ